MKKTLNNLLRILGALLICYAVYRVFDLTLLNIIPLLAAAQFLIFLPGKEEIRPAVIRTAGTVSAVLGLLTAFARYGVIARSVFIVNFLTALVCGFALGLALFPAIATVYSRLSEGGKPQQIRQRAGAVFGLSFLVIAAVWAVFFLIFYPGIAGEDAFWQLAQGLGTEPLSNHHPVAHTLIISFLFRTGLALFGTANAAAAFLSVCQMILLDLCWSFAVSRLYRLGFRPALWIGSLVFFALAPCNIIFAFSVHKDPWFAAAFTVFGAVLLEIVCDPDAGKARRVLRVVLLSISALGVGLLRSNGKFVLIVLLPFVLIRFLRSWRAVWIVTAAAAVLSFVITGPVYNAAGVTPVDTVEYLSIPLQQIARVYTDGGSASAEDDGLIREVVPVEMIPAHYYPKISDNIKNLIRDQGDQELISENKLTYLGVWLRLLVRNPDAYIEAYVDQTVGFWYPDSAGQPYLTKSTPNDLGVESEPLLPAGFYSVLATWVDGIRAVPLLGFLYSNGLTAWLMILLLGLAVLRKSDLTVLFVPPFVLWLTLLVSTPVYSDNRYMYPVFVFLPPLFAASAGNGSAAPVFRAGGERRPGQGRIFRRGDTEEN